MYWWATISIIFCIFFYFCLFASSPILQHVLGTKISIIFLFFFFFFIFCYFVFQYENMYWWAKISIIFLFFFMFFIFLFFLNPKLKKKMGSIPPGPTGQGVVVLS